MHRNAFAEDVATEIRVARARSRLTQQDVMLRMRGLGYAHWHRNTVAEVERGGRRVVVDELPGLADALETTVHALLGLRP